MKKRSIRRTTLAALMTSAMTVSIVPAAGCCTPLGCTIASNNERASSVRPQHHR